MNSKNKITNKAINKKNILMLIKEHGPLSKADISRLLNISKPSVITYVNELLNEKLVVEVGLKPSTPKGGKRGTLLEFNKYYKHILSVHLTEDKINIAILDLDFSIRNKVSFDYKINYGSEKIINKIIKESSNIIKSKNLKKKDFIGIGISSLGFIDRKRGIINYSKISGWDHIKISSILRNKLNMDVYVDNECRLFTMAENTLGSGKDEKRFVCIKISGGVGAGVIVNNKILKDRNGIVGEIGHTTIDYDSKVKCSCGNYGCLETLCSVNAIINNTKEALKSNKKDTLIKNKKNPELNEICKAFKAHDSLVFEILKDNAKKISIGISNIIKILNPSLVILYGDIECFGEEYLKIVRNYVKKETFPKLRNKYNIIFSKSGEDYSLVGAAIMVFNKFFKLEENYFVDRFIVK